MTSDPSKNSARNAEKKAMKNVYIATSIKY